MRHLTGRALSAFALIALLVVVASAMAPGDGGRSPYVSALTDLAGSDALASPQCPNKGCVSPTRCGHVTGAFGCAVSGGTCQHGICR